jgi:hypothetical protein
VTAFLTGVAILIAALLILRFLISAQPSTIVRLIKAVIGLVLGLFGLMISMRGLFFFGGPVGIYGLLLLARALGWEGMPGLRLPGLSLDGAPRSSRSGGPASGVRTRFLDMTLDHHSGAMDGLIREGAFRGRQLSELSLEEAIELLREVRLEDPDSVRLVEAWLDREYPDWRDEAAGESGGAERSSAGRNGPMTRTEALRILELEGDPSSDEVREAYKRQMKKHHPDQGGTDEDAARLNAARDLLL